MLLSLSRQPYCAWSILRPQGSGSKFRRMDAFGRFIYYRLYFGLLINQSHFGLRVRFTLELLRCVLSHIGKSSRESHVKTSIKR